MGPRRKHARKPPPFKPFSGAATQPPYNANTFEKLTFHKFVMQLISRSNIVSLLLLTSNYQDYKEEFEKFLDYIEHCDEPGKSQLARAIYPLFIYFYFNMIAETKYIEAATFFAEFVHIFHMESYTDVINELSMIKSMVEFEEHPYFRNFREKKYIFKMSPDVLENLNTFLQDIESKALSQTLCLYFYFEEDDLESFSDINSLDSISAKKPSSLTEKPVPKVVQRNKKLIKDNLTIESTSYLECYVEHPPISEISIVSSEHDMYGMDINEDGTELCIAYGEQNVFISPLEEGVPVCLDFLSDYSDDDDEEEEDDDDADEENDRTRYTPKIFIRPPRKMSFSDTVRAVKYIPHKRDSFLAASGKEIFIVGSEFQKMKCDSGHANQIWDIDINSTGSFFCSASRDMTCRLWNFTELSVLRVYSGHTHGVLTIKFHPSGLYFVSGSADHSVKVWNIENSIAERCLIGHNSPVSLISCCPDKKIIASADFDGIVKLFDIQNSEDICDIQCYIDNEPDKSQINSLCFGDEYFLAMCNNKGLTRIWDIRQPKVVYQTQYSTDDKQYTTPITTFLKLREPGSWNQILQYFEKSKTQKKRR